MENLSVTINQFSKRLSKPKNIVADEINIENKDWVISVGSFSEAIKVKNKNNIIFKATLMLNKLINFSIYPH